MYIIDKRTNSTVLHRIAVIFRDRTLFCKSFFSCQIAFIIWMVHLQFCYMLLITWSIVNCYFLPNLTIIPLMRYSGTGTEEFPSDCFILLGLSLYFEDGHDDLDDCEFSHFILFFVYPTHNGSNTCLHICRFIFILLPLKESRSIFMGNVFHLKFKALDSISCLMTFYFYT